MAVTVRIEEQAKLVTSSDHCALDLSGNLLISPAVLWQRLGEAKVGDLGVETVVEENVAGPDVPVHDGRFSELVQVSDALGRAKQHPEPPSPVQPHAGHPCKAFLERAIGAYS